MNARTYYISISIESDGYHRLHKNSCLISSDKEDLILIGSWDQEIIALAVARNNFGKVKPCNACFLHICNPKRTIPPFNSMPG